MRRTVILPPEGWLHNHPFFICDPCREDDECHPIPGGFKKSRACYTTGSTAHFSRSATIHWSGQPFVFNLQRINPLRMKLICSMLFLALSFSSVCAQGSSVEILKLRASRVEFVSEAPLEIIRAETMDMAGLINAGKGTFAFSIPVQSFRGFNSPLQMEHFHENYLESNRYKTATFKGRIIEDIDFSARGKFEVRAKGILEIHGIARERIIPANIEIRDGSFIISAEFVVPLADHDITIPKIVEQKIAREISVKLDATFTPNEAP